MTLLKYFTTMLSFLILLPIVLLCYMPVKNQMKYPPRRTLTQIIFLLCLVLPFFTWIAVFFCLDANTLFFPLLFLFFLFYHATLKTDISRNLAVFCSVCALLAFTSSFSYTFDAWLHPNSGSAQFSVEATLFQLGLSCIFSILSAYPLYRWGSYLIDSLSFPRIWFSFLPIPLAFLLFHLFLIPHKYETIHTNNVLPMYLLMLALLLILMTFIYILFYHVSMAVISSYNDRERIRFFEMQESQYLAQKNYMEQTEKLCHDFRQSIHTLQGLSDSGNWTALKEYLAKYAETLPQREITYYCRNLPLNALLNYYAHTAMQNGIQLRWEIHLPDSLNISEPDLCSLLGNILENAIAGCLTEEEENRYHCLSMTVQNGIHLYIVSINSFDGKVRKKENGYLSTKKNGSGIGISSITMTAEKYDGMAQFSHNEHEFSVDVMMRS